jgi:DNA helicase MCM8
MVINLIFCKGSICPGIYGHEIVKAGLLLGLLGGSKRSSGKESGGHGVGVGGDFDDDLVAQTQSKSDSCFNIRADIHVLIVGDPGLGILLN